MTIKEIKRRNERLKRRLWLTFVLPAFLAALIIRIVKTLARIKIGNLAESVSMDSGDASPGPAASPADSKPEPVPVTLPKVPVEEVSVERVSVKV